MEWIMAAVIMAVHTAMILFEPILFLIRIGRFASRFFGPNVLPEQFGFDDLECKSCIKEE